MEAAPPGSAQLPPPAPTPSRPAPLLTYVRNAKNLLHEPLLPLPALNGAPTLTHAQAVLCKRLGLSPPTSNPAAAATVEDYKRLFNSPLNQGQIGALADLFNINLHDLSPSEPAIVATVA
uniref:Uncharacterized protein n=1 Tax=Oryza officinalis TaxID=4535 RepID=A0A1V1H1X6_9ORYZ|nr:hypothetical protein [Oryza officinalis]